MGECSETKECSVSVKKKEKVKKAYKTNYLNFIVDRKYC